MNEEKIKTDFNYKALEGRIKEYYDTQENFSKVLGISRTALNQRLQGKIDFTSNNIYKICDLLEIKPEEISKYFFNPKSLETQTN